MGMHLLGDLKQQWEHESITDEQMIGQLLQHIEALYEEQRELRREVFHLAQSLTAETEANVGGKPSVKVKRRL
jgi:hypothetical protein